MTWIRTIPLAEADEKLRRALDAQRALYPKEYATWAETSESGRRSRREPAAPRHGRER
jgi:hypothetical protein